MRKVYIVLLLITFCVTFFLISGRIPESRAQMMPSQVYVGGVGSTRMSFFNGTPNSIAYYTITQTNSGIMGYALQQPGPSGPWSDTITIQFNFDGSGYATNVYYWTGLRAGTTDQNTCSPTLGCTAESPIHITVVTPATGVAKIQYQKDGTFVDVPAPSNVVKGDMVTFKALPSPAGSVFYSFDPTWSGASGATGTGDTTTVTFNTLSKNTHDYKTVIATVGNGGGSYTANVIVGDGVTSVDLQPVDPATIFNDNPNTGGGKRIFPDKNPPLPDAVDRRKVTVKAATTFGSGKTIYFKSFDLDDPSANTAPVDANGSTGDDNRGGVGTAAHAGLLSPVGGNGTTNSASATTDANGFASVDLLTTMQPGDNFMIAASHDLTYLNGLTVNAITLRDSSGNTVGPSTSKAKASPMLTIWRRLNVEVDSMGIVPIIGPQKNHIAGNITSINGTATIATIVNVDQNLNDSSAKLDDPPPGGSGRFENGTIRIGTTGNVTATANLQGNGTDYVQKNDGNGIVIPFIVSKAQETDVTGNVISLIANVVKLNVNAGTLSTNYVGGTITIGGVIMNIAAVDDAHNSVTIDALGNIPFNLVDDDDFNSNNTGNLQGDEGDDIEAIQPLNIFDTTFRLMQDSDANVFAPAYIRPKYDWASGAGYNNTSVAFNLNVTDTAAAIDQQLGLGQKSSSSESNSFWVVYVQLAYQEGADEDNDPNSESGTTGTGGSWTGGIDTYSGSGPIPQGTNGSLIYTEVQRDVEFNDGIVRLIRTVPHEVGHQFALKGDDANDAYGLMSYGAGLQFVPEHLNILRWRVSSPGKP